MKGDPVLFMCDFEVFFAQVFTASKLQDTFCDAAHSSEI